MTQTTIDPQMQQLTQALIDNGTRYDLEYLDRIYHPDLKFIRIDPDNRVEVLSKQDNLDFFTALKNAQAAPLNAFAEFHYADNDGQNGFVVLTRKMKQLEQEQVFLFNIYWQKVAGEWKIIRETVFIR